MREIKKNIFLETIPYEDHHRSPRNLYIIRGEDRSLMVDTSNNTERDWTILKGMVDALGIDYKKLDIFITHEHPDHTGLVPKLQELGARAFMNPDETRKRVDLLHSYLADEQARIENLRIVGVTKEETPEVYDTFMEKLPATILLTVSSMIVTMLTAIPLGIFSAIRHNRWSDYLIRFLSFIGNSAPNFFAALILMYVFSVKLGWLPVITSENIAASLVLPTLTLAIAMAAKYIRQIRAAVLEELNQDYVTGARMRGIRERTILWKHVLPNAMLPLVTLLGLSLGSLLGGTAVVEIIYNWPGMGSMAVKAISCRDYPLVQGYVLWIALLYMGINLLVDLSYERLDPRLKEER